MASTKELTLAPREESNDDVVLRVGDYKVKKGAKPVWIHTCSVNN